MKTIFLIPLVMSLLLLGPGCQHAGTPSLAMQEKFFASLKGASPEEEKALRTAQYYQLAGRFELARQELERALQQDPDNIRLLNAAGNCYDKMGEFAKAQDSYQKILLQTPGHPLAMNNLGYSYYLAGDMIKAESTLQEILAKHPGNTLARNNLGLVWCKQGKEQKALSLWRQSEGELSAQEKLNHVLAYLGRPGAPLGPMDVRASNLATSPDPGEKPEEKPPPAEIARLQKKPAELRSSAQAEVETASLPEKSFQLSRSPEKSAIKPPVKVEEVEMVVQPASYSAPAQAVPASARRPQPAVGATGKALGPAPDLGPASKARPKAGANLISQDEDEDEYEEEAPDQRRYYYRPRQWKRYWRPKMVTYVAPEPQKPAKPLKDYISRGYLHRGQQNPAGPEGAVY